MRMFIMTLGSSLFVLTIASPAEDVISSHAYGAHLAAIAEDDEACGQREKGWFGNACMISLLQTKAQVINPNRLAKQLASVQDARDHVPDIRKTLLEDHQALKAKGLNLKAHLQRLQRQLVMGFATPLTHPKRFGLLGLFGTSSHRTARNGVGSEAAAIREQSNNTARVGLWFAAFVASMVALGLIIRWYTNRLDASDVHLPFDSSVPTAVDYDDDALRSLAAVRGKPLWAYWCAMCTILLSLAVFRLTLMSTTAINEDIRLEPTKPVMQPDGEMLLETRYPVENGGQRAFEAGQGVVLSVTLACITVFAWRSEIRLNKISESLLAQFALRGATLSLFIALFLELLGNWMLGKGGLASKTFMNVGDLCTMLIVGFSEEGAKLLAVLLGTCMTAGVSVGYFSNGWTARLWCVLVENPHGLMLAGLAVGFGFMTIENSEYVMSAASVPVTTSGGTKLDDTAGLVGSIFTMITIAVRVLLNIHPWLAGISAARIVRVVNAKEGWDARISAKDFLWALMPSSLIHAAFDFLLTVAPLPVSLATPPLCWYYARWKFSQEWMLITHCGKKPQSSAEEKVDGLFVVCSL